MRQNFWQPTEWGAEIQGPRATEYLSKIQGIYRNLHVALARTISLIQQNKSYIDLWPLWRDTVIRLFNFYDYRGFWREIYNLLTVGEMVSSQIGDIWARAFFGFFQARIESQMGQREGALSKSSESLHLCRLTNDDALRASLLHFQGMLLSGSDPAKAWEYFEQSLAISKRINNIGGASSNLV